MSTLTSLDYTDGRYYAFSLGVFTQILIDSGPLDIVVMRVVRDEEPDQNGDFTRTMEIVIVPEGQIKAAFDKYHPVGTHKVLLEMIQTGIIRP